MVRTVLMALVLASATTAACGGESAGPKVVAGAPAGDVTEVTGTVTATRDGKARPLAVGDTVSGDDVIATGADGHVAIRLHHNLVPWTLGPGKQEQVAMSLAWKAPRATQTAAGVTGERSGAAGRHAEREAADTAANTEMARADEAAPDKAMAAPRAATMPPPGAAPKEAPMAEPAPAAAPPAPPPPPPPADGDAVGAGGLGLSGTGEGGGGTGEGIGLGKIGTLGHGGGTGQGQGYGAGGGARLGARAKPQPAEAIVRVFNAKGGLSTAVVTRVVRTRNARLADCVKTDAPARAMVKMTIKPDGKVDEVTVSGVSLTSTQCLQKWMRATTFPTAKEPTTASVMVQGADPLGDL